MRVAAAWALISACTPPPLTQDAYIWQRRWTDGLAAAVQAGGGAVTRWRVLVAELDASGRWTDVTPDAAVLVASGRPVVLVVRLDGSLSQLDPGEVSARLLETSARLSAAGVSIAGFEVDHDCPTSKLPAYATFLEALQLPAPLWVTALPTWLESPDLDALLAVPDGSTLQVHAVLDPRRGLFDAAQARAWADAWAPHTGRPWYVALPAYGARVAWDDEGRLAAVESERPTWVVGAEARELVVQPAELQRFAAALDVARPTGLAGLAWFRLPTADDRRAWSLPTWTAVLTGQPLRGEVTIEARPAADPALRDLLLVNRGAVDLPLPAVVRLDPTCLLADGVHGYAVETDRRGRLLRRVTDGLLRPGHGRAIGWIRCDHEAPHLQLEP